VLCIPTTVLIGWHSLVTSECSGQSFVSSRFSELGVVRLELGFNVHGWGMREKHIMQHGVYGDRGAAAI
jgi:hypothetical protein